jgi:transposase-like protein
MTGEIVICTLFTGQTSKEGIFMRYSYEFKRKCVEMYYRGEYPDTPDGIGNERFHRTIRDWVRIEESCGPDALKHKNQNKEWTPEERYALVARVLAGESNASVAISAGINGGQLYQWVRKYKIYGYNGLIPKKKGRKSKNPDMKKVGTRKPPKPNESEYEELIRLRAENELMRAEIEVIKKEIALREEKEAARLKAKKQRSSKNSEKKDTN